MKDKYLFVVYAALLASVVFFRNIEQNESSSFFKSEPINFSANDQNKTNEAKRILSTTSTNSQRISICTGQSPNEEVSSSQNSAASSAMSEYRNIFGSAVGSNIVNRKMPDTGQMTQKFILLGLIAFFFIILPLIACCYCCYCCCDKKCPLCCKRDVTKTPFTKKEMICMVVAVALYSALTFSASIAGYVYASKIESSYKSLKCTIVASLDNLNLEQTYTMKTGSQVKFMGLDSLKISLNDVSNSINQYFFNVNAYLTAQGGTIGSIDNNSKEITNMLESLKGLPLKPSFSTHTLNEDTGFSTELSSSPVDSIFYKQSTYESYVDNVKSTFSGVANGAISAMKQAVSQAQQVIAGTLPSTYTDPINQAITQITNGQKNLSDGINTISNNQDYPDLVFKIVTIILLVFYGVFMLISVLGTAGTFLGFFKKKYKIRYLLNALWCLLTLLTIVGLLICFILCILSIILMESCDESNKILNDPSYLKSIDGMDADIASYATTCKETLGGNGDLLAKFGITKYMSDLTATQTKFTTASTSFSSTSYSTFLDFMSYFQNQHKVFETYGIIYSRGSDTTYSSPTLVTPSYSYSLDYTYANDQFNQYKNYLLGTSGQTSYNCLNSAKNDLFVFMDSQCPAGTIVNFSAAQPTSADCISYESSNLLFNLADTDTRYTGCSAHSDLFNKFYDRVKKYVVKQKGKYSSNQIFQYTPAGGGPQTSENKIPSNFIAGINTKLDLSTGLGSQIDNFQTILITTLISQTTTMTDKLVGATGITNNINCLFFGQEIQNIRDNACSNLAYWVYTTFKVMMTCVFSNYTLICILYKMAMRFLGEAKHGEAVQQLVDDPNNKQMELSKMQMPVEQQNLVTNPLNPVLQ